MHVIVKNKYTLVLIATYEGCIIILDFCGHSSQLQHDKEIIKRLGHALERERKHCSDYFFTNAAVAK